MDSSQTTESIHSLTELTREFTPGLMIRKVANKRDPKNVSQVSLAITKKIRTWEVRVGTELPPRYQAHQQVLLRVLSRNNDWATTVI